MATPNPLDIQAVKDAMAKTPGLNYVDAARQVRGVQNPVAPITAPVAPLVPTPTVAPITNQEVQQGVNAVGGTAEQRRQTRTDITANQTIAPPAAPVAPSVTESPAPVTEKTGITQDAFQQAQAKSAEIKTQNDAVMAQNKQKSDLAREDAALAAQAAIPTDKKGIVNAMVTGASIPVQKTEAYNKAVVTSDLFKRFSGMTSDQLFQNLQQGQIGTELSGLLASNPNFAIAKQKYDQLQKTNSINAQARAAYNAANGETTPVVDDLAKIEAKYTAPVGTNAQAYEQFVTQDPDVKKSGLEVKTLTTQINELTKTYNDTLRSLKISNPTLDNGSLAILMRINTKETKDLLDSYISAKELAKGDLDLAMKMADGHYQATSKDIAEKQKLQFEKDKLQAEADFNKKQAEAALSDPAIAIKSVMDEMAKIGVTSTESLQTKIQQAKDYIANGGTLGDYIGQMKKLYTDKPEYKAYIAKQSGTEWQSTNITRYNPSTGANESTPIFYRKKTSGGFEAVDLAGNPIDSSVLAGGGITGGISATGDMSGLASNYPYEASFKNNNTSGITWGMSANTKKLLENAGIKISEGTARPSREGGKYVKFDNISDGLLAHKILLSQAGSDDINARLQQWVGTNEGPNYAKNLMDQAGIAQGTKFSQLTPEQLDKLVMVQIKKESPGMYKELTKGTTETPTTTTQTYDQNKIKSFEAFNGTTFPSDYKTPPQQKQFREEYDAWRASRPGTKIETGDDILNIRLSKPTEGESKMQGYASRMLNAVNNLMPLEKKFLELGTGGQVAQTYLPSLLKSSDQKIMEAEKKNFITAVLRPQSGASISPSEFASEELKYFPQPGDSKEVIIAKQKARYSEIKASLQSAGVDADGNSLSKYYNPPVIASEQTTPTSTTDKIITLKKKYF